MEELLRITGAWAEQKKRYAQGGAQAIPPTLQQSLAARLDRLGEAREVAQRPLSKGILMPLLHFVGFHSLAIRCASAI